MKELVHSFLTEKDNHVIQFIKYVACGGAATVVAVGLFYLLSWVVFPALTQSDPFTKLLNVFGLSIHEVSESLRLRNYWINKTITFVISNFIVYVINVKFVFKGGKHKRHHEMILFFIISIVAFLLGGVVASALISFFGLDTTFSYIPDMVAAVLINYAGRKFFIFNG